MAIVPDLSGNSPIGNDVDRTLVDDPATPGTAVYPVTKANSDLPNGTCRELFVGTAGTANLMDSEGNILADFPLQAGRNGILVRQVRTGGTATDIWAVY